MTLYERIMELYPKLTTKDFDPFTGTIILQNDSDGKGDYIKEWKHEYIDKPNFTETPKKAEPVKKTAVKKKSKTINKKKQS